MNREIAIKVKNITKKFNDRVVLNNINLTINKGETFVIIGGSGSGKSTLLRIMIGSLGANEGEVLINGKDILSAPEQELEEIKKKFGVSYQNAALLNSLNVAENISLPIKEHSKLDSKIIDIIVKMKLELVGLIGFEKLKTSELSGGMKKRVGLARAIALDPEIVFYDEPGAGLDPIVTAMIDKLMADLSNKLHITSVVVTHKMESAYRIADRIGMLYQGNIIEIGTPDEIKNSQNSIVKQFISGSHEGPIPLKKSATDYFKDLIGG